MAKNIVICCDGTGQELDVNRTNVVRLFSVLDRANPNAQIAYYDPGVGTIPAPGALTWVSRQLTLRAGLLAGYGLLDKVSEAYSFLVDRYEEGDRIYLFGFSRGAFTVRVLAGLLHRIGVLHPAAKNLIPYALKLYEPHYTHYDAKRREEFRSVTGKFRDFFCRSGKVDIRFLGLWDTVKAFGIFWPRSLPHIRHNPDVGIVRHALALDECRRSYLPTSWGGLDDYFEEPALSRQDDKQDVKEIWFAGDHSDVGGGHPEKESGLSWISLNWMIDEARKSSPELRFIDKKYIEKNLDLTIKSRLPTDVDELVKQLDKPDWKLHKSPSPGWRLLDLIPRPELENAPPRSANQREHRAPASPAPVGWRLKLFCLCNSIRWEPGLSVPLCWPKRKLRFRPITGRRHIKQFKRNGRIFIHTSVQKRILSGKYQLKVDNLIVDQPRVQKLIQSSESQLKVDNLIMAFDGEEPA